MKSIAENLKLSVPIEMGTETVSVLEFRKPSVGDIRRIGYPIFFTSEGDLKFNPDIVAKYISTLASIPPSAVDKMSIPDFTAAVGVVTGFFGSGD